MVNTHYYYRPPILDGKTFKAFVEDVKKLVAAAPADVVLRGKDGTGSPGIYTRSIFYNGDASLGLHHEPFVMEAIYTLRPPDRMRNGVFFDFTKTHGKPYDLIVVATLYCFLYHFPSCKFCSDSTLDELKPGFDFFFKVCEPSGDLDTLYKRPIADKT